MLARCTANSLNNIKIKNERAAAAIERRLACSQYDVSVAWMWPVGGP